MSTALDLVERELAELAETEESQGERGSLAFQMIQARGTATGALDGLRAFRALLRQRCSLPGCYKGEFALSSTSPRMAVWLEEDHEELRSDVEGVLPHLELRAAGEWTSAPTADLPRRVFLAVAKRS